MAAPGFAAAEDACAETRADVGAAAAYWERGCEGSVFVGASAGVGTLTRVDAQWERDVEAGYTSLGVTAPPRYFAWHEDAHGCALEVGVAGHERLACPARPPAPPGHPLLP